MNRDQLEEAVELAAGKIDESIDALRRSPLDDFAYAFGMPPEIWN